MYSPEPAECPCCGQTVRRKYVSGHRGAVMLQFRSHRAPCGLPCKLKKYAEINEVIHEVNELCHICSNRKKK